MKINKDVLNAMKIETIYVIKNDTIHQCMPLEMEGQNWSVAADSDGISGNIKLKVKFNGSFIYMEAEIEKKEQDELYSFTYDIKINEKETEGDDFKKAFFERISEITKMSEQWNKRKEERYDIGLDEKKIEMIRFRKPEQTAVFEKKQLPCLVNNMSYSGAKVTTMNADFQTGKRICIMYSFKNPIEQIPVTGIIRNCMIKTISEKVIISILSIEYEESPFSYKARMDSFIEELKKAEKKA
ncbi:MAG: PilZ domain-containing protein [Treponema sp.]|nr:PilZ domain-containing protein [Treponema sp.]